jgi:hypothetical protein
MSLSGSTAHAVHTSQTYSDYLLQAYYAAGATVGVASAVAAEVTRSMPKLFAKAK